MVADVPETEEITLTAPFHGFDEDDATRRLLRSRPPRAVLTWAEAVLGGTVTSVSALRGGMASATHLLTLALPGGERTKVVLRRYARPEVNDEEPDFAEREARTLRFVEPLDLPTPRLIGVDPTGDEAGAPAVLMSHLPGRVDWSPKELERWLRRLAELLPTIHDALPEPGVIRPFRPYGQESYEPPPWAHRPAVWSRAIEIFRGPTPAAHDAFIHRDFHPGNVLWRRGRVTGVVDWASASIGPPSLDVGHCRGNLFRFGLDVADRFTAVWEGMTGDRYDPWADVVTIVGFLDGLREAFPEDGLAMEEALARAVAELGGP